MRCPSSLRRRALAACAALLALAAYAAAPASAMPPVAPATPERAAALAETALAGLLRRETGDALFADQVGRTVGGAGMPALAFVAVHQLPRVGAQGQAWRLQLAHDTLSHGSGGSAVLRWPMAMMVAGDLGNLPHPDDAERLRRRVGDWTVLHAHGVAERCYERPGCFNNYKLAAAVTELELVRSGVRSDHPGALLSDPAALRASVLEWLGAELPRHARPTAVLRLPGHPAERAAILSDDGTRPLAYHALCTAWAVRAEVLAGADAPPGLRRVVRRALIALLGIAAPDGEVSWSGRGQDQVWSLAAAAYAGAAGSGLMAGSDPVLAARLRRLADVDLAALEGRLRGGVLQALPAGNDHLEGLDEYYTVTGSTALALTWLELARDALPDPGARRLRLPAEIDGSLFADPRGTGLVARRAGAAWMGLRTERGHSRDARYDFGLMRGLVLRDGVWREARTERPGLGGRPASQPAPAAGPVLVRDGRRHEPRATRVRSVPGGVELRGEWRSADGHALPASWRFTTAGNGGIRLTAPCPRGDAAELTEWLPAAGRLRARRHRLARGGFGVRFRPRGTTHAWRTHYASAREPEMDAYRIDVRCGARPLRVRWAGRHAARP